MEYNESRYSRELTSADIGNFLAMLAVQRNVSSSSQNQALAAILFLYKEVLQIELPPLSEVVRAKHSKLYRQSSLPTKFSRVLGCMSDAPRIGSCLLNVSRLRVYERLRPRS